MGNATIMSYAMEVNNSGKAQSLKQDPVKYVMCFKKNKSLFRVVLLVMIPDNHKLILINFSVALQINCWINVKYTFASIQMANICQTHKVDSVR